MTTVNRNPVPENRVTVNNVSEWQDIRAAHDQYAKDPTHNLVHVVKALGPIAAAIEHDHHKEAFDVDAKRYADLIIHAIGWQSRWDTTRRHWWRIGCGSWGLVRSGGSCRLMNASSHVGRIRGWHESNNCQFCLYWTPTRENHGYAEIHERIPLNPRWSNASRL